MPVATSVKTERRQQSYELIAKLQKTADMIRISSKSPCGEQDFRYLWEEEARTPRMNERDSAGQQAIIEG